MYCSAFSVIIHSITKLQKAMGHSSINVSLTYLRGLEIAKLKRFDINKAIDVLNICVKHKLIKFI